MVRLPEWQQTSGRDNTAARCWSARVPNGCLPSVNKGKREAMTRQFFPEWFRRSSKLESGTPSRPGSRGRVATSYLALILVSWSTFTGCHPTQPFYFHEDGDLSHYLDTVTDLEYPDVDQPLLEEVDQSLQPHRVSRPEDLQPWDLTLEEVVSIALQNSKVIKTNGNLQQLLSTQQGQSTFVSTVYDPAVTESDPQSGVEAALAAFDAQINVLGTSNGNMINNQDRPSTFANAGLITQTAGGIRAEVTKRSAGGTQYSARSITEYSRGQTSLGTLQALPTIWQQSLEVEARQPILRGRGALVNRVPVILARINTDISLANFEAQTRNMVLDIEKAYWDLYLAYHTLDTNRSERDSAQKLWKVTWEKYNNGVADALTKAQSDQQYYDFRARLEDSLRALYNTEANLRLLMGLSVADGRIIRPSDEPTVASIEFDWRAVLNEALIRSPELRQQKWRIQSQETQMIAAKNELLPQFDLGATYRWFGIGNELINADRNGLNFPAVGSTAWDSLTEGDFQESAIFMQFQMPVGFRRALAGVRNVQLQIARERARLQEMELITSHQLSTTLQNLDAFHQLVKTRFNHWKAAYEEYDVAERLYLGGRGSLDPVFDAQRRRSDARRAYYGVLAEYNKAIAEVHYRKGSLLEYNNIMLAEGPWPQKAYWDAMGLARQRDASYYLDYGWTRPEVISQGPTEQHIGEMSGEFSPTVQGMEDGEEIPLPSPSDRPTPASPDEESPLPPSQRAPQPSPSNRQPGPITNRPEEPMLNAPFRADAGSSSGNAVQQASAKSFDWSSSRRTTNSLRAEPQD